MTICKLGEDVLRKHSEPVIEITDEIAKLSKEMIAQLAISKGVGLAAPQIGLLHRMFVIQIDDDVPRVFINPQIIETSSNTCGYEEGCLSLPGVWADVIRPEKVTVQAYDERGKAFTIAADGLLARVIQHEYDHLDGLLFIDRLNPTDKARVIATYEKKRAKMAKKRRK